MSPSDKSYSARLAAYRAGLAMAWWLGAELPPDRKHPITVLGDSFAATLRALTAEERTPLTQQERVLRLQLAYVDGWITATSLELELAHLPGGLPPIEDLEAP